MIGIVLEFTRTERNGVAVSDVKANPGGGAVLTAEHFQPSGVDSRPLPGDFAVMGEVKGSGRYSVTGYLDPLSPQASAPGEWRGYSRNSAGEQMAQVWIKNDGTVVTENDNGSHVLNPDGSQRMQSPGGYIALGADGVVDINGYKIDPNGNGTTAAGVSQDGHTHPQGPDSAGNTQQATGAPIV